jgi:ligand-binding SRPBCC domain-containing protein
MPTLELSIDIAADPSAVFDLALSVDAHIASMGGSKERAVAGVTRGLLGPGDSVTWQARHFGLPFRMTSKITAWDRPRGFVDEQTKGPFAFWRHEHRFEALDAGVTRMVDSVDFGSPFGLLGQAVDVLMLTRYMRRLIERRNEWIRETLEA